MIFWVTAAVLTALVVALVLRPIFSGRDDTPPAEAFERSIYRDQLAEIDQDLARGAISPEDAEAARAEVGRRLLATDKKTEDPARVSSSAGLGRRGRGAVAILVAAMLPAGALLIYLSIGSPGLPGLPLAERQPSAGTGETSPEVAELIERLEARVEEAPEDARAWELLGQVRMQQSRPRDAADAFRRAIELSEASASLHAALGEALVVAADGTVGEEAREAFARSLEKDPGHPRARYYAGLALAQDGMVRQALVQWATLMRENRADAPWMQAVERQAGFAAAALQEARPAEGEGTEGEAAGGGPAFDPSALAGMSEAERRQAIEGMVSRLASRLEEEPEDLSGWLRLARAYGVQGKPERRQEALDRLIEQVREDGG